MARFNRQWAVWYMAMVGVLFGALEVGAVTVRHELTVKLDLEDGKLTGHDEMLFSELPEASTLTLLIAPQARILSAQVDGSPVRYTAHEGRLNLSLPSSTSPRSVQVSLAYEARFNDPVPQDPVSFDNPGFGVSGTISTEGTFLLEGSGWYPQVPEARAQFRLQVSAPRGVYAVTAGRLIKHEDQERESLSVWETDAPTEGLSLSAGPYRIQSRDMHGITLLTYLFPQSQALADRYLEAVEAHIRFYESLHGPYPFSKFAVVENFFPTGYGFPSYTLLGTAVLHLPFIPETSLKHEVAHCWWGNGVLVDYETGNWCEGLTTYVADYLTQERSSPAEGLSYRRQLLRDYATLAAESEDFPLRAFTSRTSPSTRAIGYGKAAFLFHMVRVKLGDEPFWEALRQVARERMFEKTSWIDFRDAFIKSGKWSPGEANAFFDQWLTRPGAPILSVKNTAMEKSGTRWRVKGVLTQAHPSYRLEVPVRLDTAGGALEKVIPLSDASAEFLLEADHAPERLTIDPEHHVFRLLYREEMPGTVNHIKGSERLLAVFSRGVPKALKDVFRMLLVSLNQGETPIFDEEKVSLDQIAGRDLLLFGQPQSEVLKARLQAVSEGSVPSDEPSPDGEALTDDTRADSRFAVWIDAPSGRSLAVFWVTPGATQESIVAAARKITHYGKYSALAFSQGVNRYKGVWTVSRSPLIVSFKEQP